MTNSIDSHSPIFILGQTAKVGTNYLQRLLCLHPKCKDFIIPEDTIVSKLSVAFKKTTDEYFRYYSLRNPEWRLEKDWLEGLPRQLNRCLGLAMMGFIHKVSSQPKKRIILKTPSVEGLHQFFDFFSQCHVIVLVRDGRMAIDSVMRWGGHSFESAQTFWVDGATTIHSFHESNRHRDLQYHIVRYEDLVSSPEGELRRILKFLGLRPGSYPFSEARKLPVTISSFFQSPEGNHVPREKTPDFQPLKGRRVWSPEQIASFTAKAEYFQTYFGYRTLWSADGTPLIELEDASLRDGETLRHLQSQRNHLPLYKMAKKKTRSPLTKSKTTSSNKAKPLRAPDVVFRENGDGTMALMKLDRDDCYFTLDGLAAKCWSLMDGQRDLDEIASEVAKKGKLKSSQIKKNLTSLVQELSVEHLLEV